MVGADKASFHADMSAADEASLEGKKPTSPAKNVTAVTILTLPSNPSLALPVRNGISPIFWGTFSQEAKNAVAMSFNCCSIGHFEKEYLNLGNAIIESEANKTPNTESDEAICLLWMRQPLMPTWLLLIMHLFVVLGLWRLTSEWSLFSLIFI